MADLAERVRAAGSHVTAPWTPTRAQEVLAQLKVKKVRRIQRRAAGITLLVVALLGGALLGGKRLRPTVQVTQTQTQAQKPTHEVKLSDGSLARALDETSQLLLVTTQPERVLIRLHGTASFQVTKNPQRLYRVETERVAVEVLGTRFTVSERPDRSVHVAVSEGRVRVLWDGKQRELAAGSSGEFAVAADPSKPSAKPRPIDPPAEVATPAEALAARPPILASTEPGGRHALQTPTRSTRSEPATPAKSPPLPLLPARESWQSLAEQGKFEQAYQQAFDPSAGSPFVRDGEIDPAELLLLADVARFSGHPSDAVLPLRRLMKEHPRDPRSPLASFTLGRILLDDLGQPREAAQSFRHAEDLDPDGPLSQDALGREVEAWSRAGEQSLAHSRAEDYVRRYPTGRRLRSVRRYGDLD